AILVLNAIAGSGDGSDDAANLEASDEAEEPVSFTVTFAGDCTLGTDENFSYSTSFNASYESAGDPSYFLQNVAGIFESDDLTIVNMEGTLTDSTDRADKTYAFKGDEDYAQVLSSSGVEAANLANNHSKDYGEQSYEDTIEALDEYGITSFGYDRIAYFDIKGIRVALIGINDVDLGLSVEQDMIDLINEAKDSGAQLVLVYMHWGVESEYVPNEDQMQLGHSAIDAGADLVVGSHPHVIQGYEIYNGKYIVYSLGNFCFGGNSNPADQDAMIFQETFTFVDGELQSNDDVAFIGCLISSESTYNNYQPALATGASQVEIEEKISSSTAQIAEMASSSDEAAE
ncbi:MAG: CapA family protein, partial [Eggerthellaceae bacterium]|nr:CapA family protein [Eggerthellaceae bacterium]